MPGPEKLRHPLNQPDAKSKINCGLVICIFPALMAVYIYSLWDHMGPRTILSCFFWSYIVIKLVQFCSVTTYHTGHLADHHDKCCHAAVISHISLRWALYQTFRCFRAIQFGSDLTRKWMAGYIRRTHSWKRSGKKSSYLFLTLFFIKPTLLMRIKNATFRHNQLVNILALPFLPLAFPLNFFFLFSPPHYFLILTLRMRSPNLSLCLPEQVTISWRLAVNIKL